jgi:hypothetical protein
MNTPHQFAILGTSTQVHSDKVEALRRQHGSLLAFHGLGLSNWHNVLRQTLSNAGNTVIMSGAAYGGIDLGANSGLRS